MATIMVVATVMAKPVTKKISAQVAAHILSNNDVLEINAGVFNNLAIYVTNSGSGFAIVATDDCSTPVLAYSTTQTIIGNDIPDNVKEWLNGYDKAIDFYKANGIGANNHIREQWAILTTGGFKDATDSSIVVDKLVQTTWNQRPYYNYQCPYSTTDSTYAVAGCTAIAMAQIMKYWDHPAMGWSSHAYRHSTYGVLSADFGNTTYQWDSMPNQLTSATSTACVNAVAQLVYHAGVSVNMNYGVSSSGAATLAYGDISRASAENALKTYFKYSSQLHSEIRTSYNDSAWIAILKNEIDHRRPVLYTGYDTSAGHAFILDGYDTASLFHVNWGWAGSYDGFYAIGALNPGSGGIGGNSTYTFNLNNSIIIGIEPVRTIQDSISIQAVAADTAMGIIYGNGRYATYRDTVLMLAYAKEGYVFNQWKSNNTANPLYFIANTDIRDTALFTPITGDTISYTQKGLYTAWSDDYSSTTEWGMRIAPSMITPTYDLAKVQMYVYSPNVQHNLNIYQGERPTAQTLIYSSNVTPVYNGWTTISLPTPISIDDTKPLWITFSVTGGQYPAAAAQYSGNSDGVWYNDRGTWVQFDHQGNYYTWLIRAIMQKRTYTITALSNDDYMGSVTGSGIYNAGDTVTLFAEPIDRSHEFLRWSNGITVNPYVFIATADTTITAIFDMWRPRYTLTAQPSDPTYGTVSGSGYYRSNDSITIVATPFDNYKFIEWSNGSTDSIITIVIVSDTTLTATFQPLGAVQSVSADEMHISINRCNVSIKTEVGTPFIDVYDISGRKVAYSNSSSATFTLPGNGIYIIRAANHAPRRIVITAK